MYNFKTLEDALKKAQEHYKMELSSVRSGRATPALLDGIRVEAYGTPMPLNQVGSVTIEDARSLRVSAWDQSQLKNIEKAITDADLGVSVSSDEKGVRVSFPDLTTERREQLVKLTRVKLEETRTSVRRARDDCWNNIQDEEKEKLMTEDEKFRAKDDMEELVKKMNQTLEEMAQKKEEELGA